MKPELLKSKELVRDEFLPYKVSCWDEYGVDGYSYFPTEAEAREYAESIKSKVVSIDIDLVDREDNVVKIIYEWS